MLASIGASVRLHRPGGVSMGLAADLAIEHADRGKQVLAPENLDTAIATADLVISDSRATLESATGLPLEQLRAKLPGKVLALASINGLTGPLAEVPATGIDAQALSSVAWVLGEEGRPQLTIPTEISPRRAASTSGRRA